MDFSKINGSISIKKFLKDYYHYSDECSKIICPFHDDNSPSMVVNEDTNTVYCYSCKKLSSPIEFKSKISGEDLIESARQLANKYNIDDVSFREEDSKLRLRRDFINKSRKSIQKKHYEYLSSRGISKETAEHYNLGGFGDWLVQPVYSLSNIPMFYNNRHIVEKKHFIESGACKSKCLGGANKVRDLGAKTIITEGYLDTMSAYDLNISAVCIFGSRASDDQVKIANDIFSEITIGLDNDVEGVKGSLDLYKKLKVLNPTMRIDFAILDGKDLGEHLEKNDSVETEGLVEWSNKNGFNKDLFYDLLVNYTSPLEFSVHCTNIAEINGVSVYEVKKELDLWKKVKL